MAYWLSHSIISVLMMNFWFICSAWDFTSHQTHEVAGLQENDILRSTQIDRVLMLRRWCLEQVDFLMGGLDSKIYAIKRRSYKKVTENNVSYKLTHKHRKKKSPIIRDDDTVQSMLHKNAIYQFILSHQQLDAQSQSISLSLPPWCCFIIACTQRTTKGTFSLHAEAYISFWLQHC